MASASAEARRIQDRAPLGGFDIYVAGLHCAKDQPDVQMQAHHYCKQVNSTFLQRVLFDGNSERANLIGIKYIVSERLFERLPGLPSVAEHALMRVLVNSYGKTWHVWHTGRRDGVGAPADPLPYGDAHLMSSSIPSASQKE